MTTFAAVRSTVSESFRFSPDTVTQDMTSVQHLASRYTFRYDSFDYGDGFICELTGSTTTEILAMKFDHDMPTLVMATPVSASIMLSGTFTPRRTTRESYVADSLNDLIVQDTFDMPDYRGLIASPSTLDVVDVVTTSNVDPLPPLIPAPPPEGPHDLNRFRKSYTHIRVNPRIRKYNKNRF